MAENAPLIFWFPTALNPGFGTEVSINIDEFEGI